MNPDEFNSAKQDIGLSDDELAATLALPTSVVRAWSEGSVRVSGSHAAELRWRAAVARRQAAFEASGLEECSWLDAHLANMPATVKAVREFERAIDEHLEACPLCQARKRFDEELGPLPPPPRRGFDKLVGWIERIPAWARPATIGAILIGGIVLIRVLFAFPRVTGLADAGQLLFAVTAAAAAGAAGGGAFSVVRPALRRLGAAGAYLTGIACVLAYVGALVLMAKLAFDESLVSSARDLVLFAILIAFFGMILGHAGFREEI